MPDVWNIKDSLQWFWALKGARALYWFAALVTRLWDAPGPIWLGDGKSKKKKKIRFGDFSKERVGHIGGHFSKDWKRGEGERGGNASGALIHLQQPIKEKLAMSSAESWPHCSPSLCLLPIRRLPQGFHQPPFVRLIPFHSSFARLSIYLAALDSPNRQFSASLHLWALVV